MSRARGKTSANRKVSPGGHHIAAQCRVFGPHVAVAYREPLRGKADLGFGIAECGIFATQNYSPCSGTPPAWRIRWRMPRMAGSLGRSSYMWPSASSACSQSCCRSQISVSASQLS